MYAALRPTRMAEVPVKVGLLRLPLATDASDVERLRAAAAHATEKMYVLLEGDWGTLSRAETQKRRKSRKWRYIVKMEAHEYTDGLNECSTTESL